MSNAEPASPASDLSWRPTYDPSQSELTFFEKISTNPNAAKPMALKMQVQVSSSLWPGFTCAKSNSSPILVSFG